MPATKAQLQWNGGKAGKAPASTPSTSSRCRVEKCGQVGRGPVPDGFTRVRVKGSSEPARDYCSPYCTHFGTALAELRSPAEGGDRG
ncbi:hypothetical protein AB0A77_28535 [Streptomyces varsoviensis]|uniref:hypothetical protein n=1 Tax=Streptomyces varsoviensis TaxID=67373 RepID=UPI0033EF6059